MSKASSMARLAKLLGLVQVLANAACSEPLEPVIDYAAEVIGTWDYAASFVAARSPGRPSTTVVGDSVTCAIAGVTITAGNPKDLDFIGMYRFDAEASGGTVECTGDGTDDFVQELPAHVAVELLRTELWVSLDFAFPTPLGLMQVENDAASFNADDSISADYWRGRVFVFAPIVDADMEFPFNGRGRFTAVRR